MIELIVNESKKEEVLKAFEAAKQKKSGKTGSYIKTKKYSSENDKHNTIEMIAGSNYAIVTKEASNIYSETFSILRKEPAMRRFYGANGVLVHEEKVI